MIASEIRVKEVLSRADLRRFIYLPQKLYANYQNWVPPVYDDEWKLHNPRHNKSLDSCHVIRLIAFKDGRLCGRVMGIIHRFYNRFHKEKAARFFQFDCIDDQVVAHSLLQAVEDWAKSKGMETITGPFGFSDKDPQGAQIEGFEHLPVLVTPANPPYIPRLIEAEDYTKNEDCVSYGMPVPEKLPEIYEQVYNRLSGNTKFHLVAFTTKRQMKPYILPVLRLVNETYSQLFGFVPMTEREMKNLASQYMFVLDPSLVKIVETSDKKIAAFIVAMADMSRGLQKANGKILPFGFLHMLRDAKKTKQLNLMLGAIKQRYRGIGLNVLLAKALTQTALKKGFTLIDSHLVLESNTRMCAELANLGGTVYKRYRIYKKAL